MSRVVLRDLRIFFKPVFTNRTRPVNCASAAAIKSFALFSPPHVALFLCFVLFFLLCYRTDRAVFSLCTLYVLRAVIILSLFSRALKSLLQMMQGSGMQQSPDGLSLDAGGYQQQLYLQQEHSMQPINVR